MTDSVGESKPGDGEGVTTTTARRTSSSIPLSATTTDDQGDATTTTTTTRSSRLSRSSVGEVEPVAGTSADINQHNSYQNPTSSGQQAVATSVERQNSTSSTRSGEGVEREQRRFPFLDFDSGAGPRHIQALTMIQQWARNSVGATIPMLGSSSNNANSNDGPGFTIHERGHGRGVQRQTSDTQISMPAGSGGELLQQTPPVPTASNAALSLPSRLARGLLQSSNFRRRSDDIPEVPVSYNQATSTASMGTATARDRETLTLDIEGNGGLGGSSAVWTNVNENRNDTGGGDANNDESRRPSADGQSSSGRRGGGGSPTGSPTAAGGSTEETPTAPGDILRDSPETRAFIEEINQYTTLRPFLVLMLLKGSVFFMQSLVDHGSGIVCFLALIVTFSHGNSLLKKEISKQRKRNLLFLVMIVVNLIGCAAFIYYVFSEEELYYALGFMSTKVDLTSFWMLMWVVAVTDYIAKFGSIIAKSFIVAMPTALIPFQKRGIYYLFIEQTSQLYRSALPIHHWLLYLYNSYEGSMKMFGLILGGMYTLFKLVDSVQRVKDWHSAFKKLFQNVHYGTTVTAKELDSMDSIMCPICHDSFTCPVRLSCSHVFCEECVSTWFDRGMTCPLCRCKVVDDPSFRDGTTAQYIQFF